MRTVDVHGNLPAMRTLFRASLAAALTFALTGCFGNSSSNNDQDSGVGTQFDATGPGTGADGGNTADVAQQHDTGSTADVVTDTGAADAPGNPNPFPTGTIDFGLTDCGSAPVNKAFSFKNNGTQSITYTASITAGSPQFSISGASGGTVAPGVTANITLAVAPVPTTSTAGTPLTGTLTLKTNVPGYASVDVPLQVTPRGGSFTLTPNPASFGQVPITVQAPDLPLTLTNVGNGPVDLTLGASTDPEFSVSYTGSPAKVTLAPGASLPSAVARFLASSVGQKSGSVPLQPVGAMCNSAVSAIAMTGEGTTSPVTVSPNPLSFGPVTCGQAAPPGKVTITNTNAFSLTYTATLGLGAASPYTISPASGSVGAKSNGVITVTPNPIPVPSKVPGSYGDTLTITTTPPQAQPLTVTIQESASGPVLAIAMPNTGFGGIVANTTAGLGFTVTNSGDVAGVVTVSASGPGFGASITGSTTAGAGGGTVSGTATYSPTSTGAVSGTITATAPSSCSGPASIGVTATGLAPVANYSNKPVSVAATCGGGGLTSTNIVLNNTGTSPLTVYGAKSQNGFFAVLSTPPSIAPGSSGNILIQAVYPPAGTPASSNPDNVVFQTNELGQPTHLAPVQVGILGANLSYATGGTATVTSCGYTTYTIQNTGNMDANVVPTSLTEYPGNAPYGFQGTFGSANGLITRTVTAFGGTVSDGVGAGCGSPCAKVETFTTTNTTTGGTTGICIPLPALNLAESSCNLCCIP